MNRSANTSLFATLTASASVLLTSTAFAGVLIDARWVLPVVIAVALITGAGIVGRTLGWWAPLIVLAQLVLLLTALTALFSGNALLGVFPSPDAVAALGRLLAGALDTVRNGTPPVPAEPGLQALVCLGLGLVSIMVDAIAVGAGAPAVSGLVLLCVFAVPASLDPMMLPWWSFVAGSAGFVLLLASGRTDRHPVSARSLTSHPLLSQQAITITSAAGVLALLTGTVFTGVGTEGRLPGGESVGYGASSGGVGLNPFTSLRGQLNRNQTVELFRVRGLPEKAYLRALSLRQFDPKQGWSLQGLTQGVDAHQPQLPLPEGTDIARGTQAQVQINPVGYRDPWLPMFGMPRSVSGMGGPWRYDPASGVVFTQTRQESKPYTEQLVLPSPTPQELRRATGPIVVDPAYRDPAGVSPQIKELADRITANQNTPFDKAAALNRYFLDPANGFRYDLSTGPPTSADGLSDFLLRNKHGFCEQFASSMAVLLRAEGIPSRVSVGFTSGQQDGDERVITTNDAHAWVEAYFPGWGWTTFDPTPLPNGRGTAPNYVRDNQPAPPPPSDPAGPDQQAPPAGQPPAPPQSKPGSTAPDPAPAPVGPSPAWPALGALVLVIAVLAGPAALRELRRRRRLGTVRTGAARAGTAWREVLDSFLDRGARPLPTESARAAASRLANEHGLDTEAAHALHEIVRAVEREWYAPADGAGTSADPDLASALDEVLSSLRRNAPMPWTARLLPRSALRLRTPAA